MVRAIRAEQAGIFGLRIAWAGLGAVLALIMHAIAIITGKQCR